MLAEDDKHSTTYFCRKCRPRFCSFMLTKRIMFFMLCLFVFAITQGWQPRSNSPVEPLEEKCLRYSVRFHCRKDVPIRIPNDGNVKGRCLRCIDNIDAY